MTTKNDFRAVYHLVADVDSIITVASKTEATFVQMKTALVNEFGALITQVENFEQTIETEP